MKKLMIVCMGILLSLLSAAMPIGVEAAGKSCSWYCTKGRNGLPPSEFEFIQKYGGYSVDLDHVGEESDKVIYLTFDVGYENGNVGKILDILNEENIPAAFFVLENVAKRNSDLLLKMQSGRHLICNHTATHRDMSKIDDINTFEAELKRLEAACSELCGIEVKKYYRPPEGRFSEENMKMANELGYKTIFWSFAYADWDNDAQMQPSKAVEKVMGGTHNGMVLLLHPTSSTNVAILPELIKRWRNDGYRFGTLDELTA